MRSAKRIADFGNAGSGMRALFDLILPDAQPARVNVAMNVVIPGAAPAAWRGHPESIGLRPFTQ
ncbi:MAG: hypothetical protein ACREP2_04095 [Rhodanobacteraceae bacterium]